MPIWKKFLLGFISLFLLATLSFLIWTQYIYKADPAQLQEFFDQNQGAVTVTEHSHYWEILPKDNLCQTPNCTPTGFIFYPGAKVDAQAYFYKLGYLVTKQDKPIQLFIIKPPLHLAIFGINQATEIIENNPEIKQWILGGHSLGGAMACEYVASHTDIIKYFVLLGSHCSNDLSHVDLKVVSIHGSLNGVLEPEKVMSNRKNLPPNNEDFTIEGMNHAQAGNYGEQSGDNTATKADDAVKEEIIALIESEQPTK